MEDEEDDLYGSAAPEASEQAPANGDAQVKPEQVDASEGSDEDSDDVRDHLRIYSTRNKPNQTSLYRTFKSQQSNRKGSKPSRCMYRETTCQCIPRSNRPIRPPRAPSVKPQATTHARTNSIDPPPPSKVQKTEHARATPGATTVRGAPTHHGKEGKDFPQVRTSNVDLNANPNWPGVNKPITLLDIDADLAENSKLWRLPGTDQTDFFNYGFDEYTWTQYCVRQQSMAGTIAQQKDEDMQMKAMLGMGGGDASGGMPGMPGPAPPGMPGMDQMMQMMSQGMDPSKMDMNSFMSMMGGMPGGPGGHTPQPPGGPGYGGQGGYGGQSPHPQGQFQPPSGPGGGQGFGQNMSMDGMSPQQIAIMQQEQASMGSQGGGRGRGGRRGRGGYY
jgi:pre-mRNA 3'-end-processing factor FIP1